MNEKVRATAATLVIASGIVIGSGVASAEPATTATQQAMAGFSAPPCLPLILPPAVNVNAFLICLA
ncbi:hypothetical protein [Nocardia asiatica]|uniref:hypothetical protein n=1 Tax=Nocardia asiatica TaxID=209252 RepID=UPI003EE074B6